MRLPLPSVANTDPSPAPAVAPKNASTAMTLADFTHPNLILPHLWGKDVPSVIQELCQRLQREKRIPDLLPFYHAALNREFLNSTDMEAGMAFPHARLPGLKTLSFALGRSRERLPWGTRMAPSVRLVFLTAVPASDSTHYMFLMAGLARLANNRQLVEKLHAAGDAFQIVEVLKQVEWRASSSLNSVKQANP
jgi:mannitol/fructose-specific phosphotransferase system IIA component (Ntr-type)